MQLAVACMDMGQGCIFLGDALIGSFKKKHTENRAHRDGGWCKYMMSPLVVALFSHVLGARPYSFPTMTIGRGSL